MIFSVTTVQPRKLQNEIEIENRNGNGNVSGNGSAGRAEDRRKNKVL